MSRTKTTKLVTQKDTTPSQLVINSMYDLRNGVLDQKAAKAIADLGRVAVGMDKIKLAKVKFISEGLLSATQAKKLLDTV